MIKEGKKRKNPLFFLTLGAIIVLSLVQLFISHRLAISGDIVRDLESQANRVNHENQLIREEVNGLTSLASISRKAGESGYQTAGQVVHLSSQVPIALALEP